MQLQKAKVTERLAQIGAFAVVRVETVERGLEIADGLVRGGVPAMEISYTNANAGDVIAAVKAKYGDKMCVGAGTVMEAATARLAIMSGAEFVVANMESEEVARVCNLYQVPYAPGGMNACFTENLQTARAFASAIKYPFSQAPGKVLTYSRSRG